MRHAILAAALGTALLAGPAAGQDEPHRSHPLATPTAAEDHWAGAFIGAMVALADAGPGP